MDKCLFRKEKYRITVYNSNQFNNISLNRLNFNEREAE